MMHFKKIEKQIKNEQKKQVKQTQIDEIKQREQYFLQKEKEKTEIKERLALAVKLHNEEERYL